MLQIRRIGYESCVEAITTMQLANRSDQGTAVQHALYVYNGNEVIDLYLFLPMQNSTHALFDY